MRNDSLPVDLQAQITALKSENAELKLLVKYYEEQFRLSKHRQFGAKSEKSEYDFLQLSLFNEVELLSDANAPEPELVEVEKHYRVDRSRLRTRLTTDKLPDNLPVEVVEHELSESERVCPMCGNLLHTMGCNTRRELVIIPAQVQIREHVSHTYACRECERHSEHTPIIKALMPEPVIKSGFASPEAVAHIMVQKFVMGVPLYRQEQEWKRQGIPLSRQTMSNWLIKASEDWLEPIYDELKRRLTACDVLHADETTLQVLKEPGKTAQSKSYMWLYRTSGDAVTPIVLCEYQPSRKASHAAEFLKDFKGYLHADGYDGYHKLPDSITVVGCWSHLRRKFDEALKIIPEEGRADSLALAGKRHCDKLFELERDFASLAPAERLEKRQEISKSLVETFFAWAETCGALPKTPVGKAVHYALTQRKYLERYLLGGRLEISNNRAERSIKPFVIGRKNWLFANTTKGAKASAVMYSLIETAKENRLNPFEYLVYVFRHAPCWDVRNNADKLEKLMPQASKTAVTG